MNCKLGDLAIVINGPRSAGRIVKVLRAYQDGEVVTSKCGTQAMAIDVSQGAAWHIEGHVFVKLPGNPICEAPASYDKFLRPLPDLGPEEELLLEKELESA